MPQPFKNAVMTRSGALLLTRAQAGEAKIEFTRIAIGNGEYTEDEKTLAALQDMTGLISLKNSYGLSGVEVFSEHSVKITALITNQDPAGGGCLVDEGYFINEMGLFAKEKGGGDDTEILYSIAVTDAEKGDFMPPYNGFCAAQILQEYYATVSSSAEVTIQTSGAFVPAQDFEEHKRHCREEHERLEERLRNIETSLQWIMERICGYSYDASAKRITSIMPHGYADGILTFPEGTEYDASTKRFILKGGLSGGVPVPGTGTVPGADSGNVQEIAQAAARIVEGNMQEISAAEVKQMFSR